MKSPLHNLSRVAMLDLSDALVAGRLKPPYLAFQIAEYVPESVAEDIGADMARMDAVGMQPGAYCGVSATLGGRTRGESTDPRRAAVGLDRAGCSRQRQPRHRRRGEGALHLCATKRPIVNVRSAPR